MASSNCNHDTISWSLHGGPAIEIDDSEIEGWIYYKHRRVLQTAPKTSNGGLNHSKAFLVSCPLHQTGLLLIASPQHGLLRLAVVVPLTDLHVSLDRRRRLEIRERVSASG